MKNESGYGWRSKSQVKREEGRSDLSLPRPHCLGHLPLEACFAFCRMRVTPASEKQMDDTEWLQGHSLPAGMNKCQPDRQRRQAAQGCEELSREGLKLERKNQEVQQDAGARAQFPAVPDPSPPLRKIKIPATQTCVLHSWNSNPVRRLATPVKAESGVNG